MNFLVKKLKSQAGAMFGLDARIALAIFGGLSIIAGASVISVIAQTQTTALITEMDNLSKGYINFKLDTAADTNTFTDLINNGSAVIGWNGPYITMSSDNHVSYGTTSLVYGHDTTVGVVPAACGTPCSVWLKITDLPQTLADRADLEIDGAVGGTAGNLRSSITAGTTVDIHFKMSRQF